MVYTTEDPSHAVVKCATESSLQLKQEVLGSIKSNIPRSYPWFFPLPAGTYTNVDGMKDLRWSRL